jgi:hypothetical protein
MDGIAISGGGGGHGAMHEPPPVDYYRASYAFLVGQGNHQQVGNESLSILAFIYLMNLFIYLMNLIINLIDQSIT